MLRRIRSVFRALSSRADFENGMTEELQAHVEHLTEDLVRSGLPRQEAYRRARAEMGGLNSIKEECRQARGLQFFDELARNVSYAIRSLRKSPAFAATALVTVALCLGANLTIFAVIDAILIRPLPFPNPGKLVTIFNTYPKAGVDRDGASIANYYERRNGAIPAFSSVSLYAFGSNIAGLPGSVALEQTTSVSPEFFRTLGSGPALGRDFTDAETQSGADGVVILSDAFWKQHFNADRSAIGRKVWVDSIPHVVIGVLPPAFRFLSSKAQLYLPLSSTPEQRLSRARHSGGNVVQMIARLRDDATLAQAQAAIDAQNASLEREDPQAKMIADAGFRSVVVSLHNDQVSGVRPMLLALQASVFTLLLIGLVNLVNLILVRASGRVKEIAVRQALGASATRIASEALVESVLIAVSGGVLSLAVAFGGIQLVKALGADRLPLGGYIAWDGRLAMISIGAAFVLGIVLALPTAFFNLRLRTGEALQSESRTGTTGRATMVLRHSFVTAQIALGFVLLTGAGLLGLSLKRAMDVFPGFQSDHAIAGQILLVGNRYPSPETGVAFGNRLSDQLRSQPGVSSVGFATNIPFSGSNGKSAAFAEGHVSRPGESPRGYYSAGVFGDYFPAMGLLLRSGRFLTSEDSERNARVCVVDEDFARYNWPNENPLGQRVFQGSQPGKPDEAFTVVGVVGDIKQAGLTDDTAQGAIYYPFPSRPDYKIFAVVRGGAPPERLETALEQSVRRIDPDLAVNQTQSMNERISASLIDRRAPVFLSGIFSAIALILITVGTYGVLSYVVAQRRRDIAIRMALGARPENIQRQFFSLALRLLVAGIAIGLFGAWATGRAMEMVLYHVTAHSPAVLAVSTATVALIALAACLAPARRAARISPLKALSEY